MEDKITVRELLKRPDAIGRVFVSGIETFIVVEVDNTGLSFMRFYKHRYMGIDDPDTVHHTKAEDLDEVITLQDTHKYRITESKRWAEIAARFPAIG